MKVLNVLSQLLLDTMNTSFNQFFDKEYSSIWKRHKSAYSRLVKKWVYNPEYHQRFSSYFSSMIKDYSNEECSSFRRVYPPKNDIMKSQYLNSFSPRCVYREFFRAILYSYFHH